MADFCPWQSSTNKDSNLHYWQNWRYNYSKYFSWDGWHGEAIHLISTFYLCGESCLQKHRPLNKKWNLILSNKQNVWEMNYHLENEKNRSFSSFLWLQEWKRMQVFTHPETSLVGQKVSWKYFNPIRIEQKMKELIVDLALNCFPFWKVTFITSHVDSTPREKFLDVIKKVVSVNSYNRLSSLSCLDTPLDLIGTSIVFLLFAK